MNEKQQKPHSVFGFGFRPTVSVYSVSVMAKNFHFGASLELTYLIFHERESFCHKYDFL
jgi:hypothetical protein